MMTEVLSTRTLTKWRIGLGTISEEVKPHRRTSKLRNHRSDQLLLLLREGAKMNIFYIVLLALSLMLKVPENRVSSEVTFCNFELPRNIKMAHADFNAIYSFELDEEGHPIKITKVKDDHIGETVVSSCLAGWRFHGSKKGAHMAVVFQWQHADGWTEMSITGPDFFQKIKITGQRCPYSKMLSENPT